jgi:hypothetical protein
MRAWPHRVPFGWLSPVAGHAGSDFQPIVMYQEEHILPTRCPTSTRCGSPTTSTASTPPRPRASSRAGPRSPGWPPASRREAVPPRARPRLPQPGAHRQDGVDAAGAVGQPVHPRHRRRLARGRVPVLRLRLPVDRHAAPPARRGRADLPADVDRGAPHVHRRGTSRSTTPPPPRGPTWCRRCCIGSSGEQIGLPIVGRQADLWNGKYRDDDDWRRKRSIVDEAAESPPDATRPTSRAR